MAINFNEWKEKFPQIEEDKLRNAITDGALNGLTNEELERSVKEKFGIDAKSNIQDQNDKESNYQTTNDSEDEEENPTAENQPDTLKEQVESSEEPVRHESHESIPFENPEMSDIEVPEEFDDDDEDDNKDEYQEEEPIPEKPKPRSRPRLDKNEMITKTLTLGEYEEVIKPFMPFFEDIGKDPSLLNKLASQIDGNYLPPYIQLKPYIINHPIKDPKNTMVLIDVISEVNVSKTEQKFVPVTQGKDMTRALAEQAFFETSFVNYDNILRKMFDDRRALVSLVYILENYLEQKQVSPFELSIPKKVLIDSVEDSFKSIKNLITENVVKEIGQLKKNLQGEMVDVGGIVEKNMTRFDTQIQNALTKVLWKVKTDVESTNMEDIKKSILFLLNKRAAAYDLGGMATAIMGVMLDDLERKLMETGFKLDNIGKHRIYTVTEISKRLNYKRETFVSKVIPKLKNRNLIRLYQNKTFSL